jgi:hypothetical protein
MKEASHNGVKILFRFYSDVTDEWMVETMWAELVDEVKGLYRIDNIPFHVPMVASNDIVRAEFDEDEGCITYRETVQRSGNSTVWVALMDKKRDLQELRKMFAELGCQSEGMNDVFFTMEVPASVDYTPVRAELIALEEQGIISYAEPCLSGNHQY